MSITLKSTLTTVDRSFNVWRRNTNKLTFAVGDITTQYTTDGTTTMDGGVPLATTNAKYDISSISSIVVNGLVVTVTCSSEHNLFKDGSSYDSVVITGASPAEYNGAFAVTSVLDDYRFTYNLGSIPATYVSGGNVAYSTSDIMILVNDLNARKVKRSGDSISYLKVVDTTTTTTTTTGALVVLGGVGFNEKLNVLSDVTIGVTKFTVAGASGNTNILGTLTVANTTDLNGVVTIDGVDVSTTIAPTGTGTLTVNPATLGTINNMQVGNVTRSTGAFTFLAANNTVTFTKDTAATNNTSGTLIVTGGVGVSGNIYAGGLQNTPVGSVNETTGKFTTIVGTDTTASTSNITGAAKFAGGLGVAGDIYAGGLQNTTVGNTTAASGRFTTLVRTDTAAIPLDVSDTQVPTTLWVMNQASNANPVINGSVSAGTGTRWSRADHVHPSDTSRLAKAGDTATGKITFPAVSVSVSGSFNIPNGTGNTAVSGDVYATSGSLYWHNGSSVKGIAFLDSNITGTSSNVTGVVLPANGGTGLSAFGTANYILGSNSAGNAVEYKQIVGGTGITISHQVGGITVTNNGVIPNGSATDTFFKIGQNLIVGSWNGTVHSGLNSYNTLELRPGVGVSITNLLSCKSDNAGSIAVFNVALNGDLAIGANKFSVTALTGSTSISGDLSVAGNFTNNATFNGTVSSVGDANFGTSVGNKVSIGVNSVIQTFSLTTTSTSQVTLASVPGATYRTAKFIIQVSKDAGTDYQACEILAMHNDSLVDHTEYAAVSLGSILVTFSVDYNGGNMRLLITPQNTFSTTFKVTAYLTKV